MKKIAITLVHNKGDKGNQAQIEELKSLLEAVEDIHPEYNDSGEVVGQYSTFHQEFIGLDIEHEVKVYQVIPYGVEPPPNRYDINSGGIVQYGEGDEDKTGEHPRFFNWGAKRGMDNGAEVSIYIDHVTNINVQKIKSRLQTKEDFSEETFGKIISKEEFKRGQLPEATDLQEAISEKRFQITSRRVRNG